jgi:hypothetical protein
MTSGDRRFVLANRDEAHRGRCWAAQVERLGGHAEHAQALGVFNAMAEELNDEVEQNSV